MNIIYDEVLYPVQFQLLIVLVTVITTERFEKLEFLELSKE
jgi:hypothetical protein